MSTVVVDDESLNAADAGFSVEKVDRPTTGFS